MPIITGKDITVLSERIVDAKHYHEHVHYRPRPIRKKRALPHLDIMFDAVVTSALHNSGERFDPPRCHPKTRTAVLERMKCWAESDTSFPLMWLSGPAGAGKSAIAQTLCEYWDQIGVLAASFFFSRTGTGGRNSKTGLVATIAYQVLRTFPEMELRMEKAIEKDRFLMTKTLNVQLDQLVILPLMDAYPGPHYGPRKVIVVDGLDECSGESAQREILFTLVALVNKRSLPFVLFIASRPEHQIRDIFSTSEIDAVTARLVLGYEFNPDADIELFIRATFAEIRTKNYIDDATWPSEDAIQSIVKKSSGQFIYASTVVKYISAAHNGSRHCLQVVLGIKSAGSDTPYAEVDALYIHILSSVKKTSFDMMMDVFSYLLMNSSWGPWIFAMPYGDFYSHMTDLHSILSVSPPTNRRLQQPEGPFVRFYHASFSDFLMDYRRSAQFHLNVEAANARIAHYIMKHTLTCMSLDNVTTDWFADPAFTSELMPVFKKARPDLSLQLIIEAAFELSAGRSTLLAERLGLAEWKPEKSLMDYLQNCEYVRELLRYLKRCYNQRQQAQSPLRRVFASRKLFPLLIRAYIRAMSCDSPACIRHCAQGTFWYSERECKLWHVTLRQNASQSQGVDGVKNR